MGFRSSVKPGSSGSADIDSGLSRISGSALGRYMWACRWRGSRSQPRRAPLAIYSSIFAWRTLSLSESERSSTTKSGQIRGKGRLSSTGSALNRSLRIQEASGERTAPLGNVKPVLGLPAIPVPSAPSPVFQVSTNVQFFGTSFKIDRRHYFDFSFAVAFDTQVIVLGTEAPELLVGHLNCGLEPNADGQFDFCSR